MKSGDRSSAFAAFAILAWLGVTTPLAAHHGGAVEWGDQQLGPITGTATKFAFQFPHVYVSVDVPSETGVPEHWTLVTRWTPTILRQHGWSRESIKPGDTVTARYLPHVQSPRIGSIVSIDVNGESLPINFN